MKSRAKHRTENMVCYTSDVFWNWSESDFLVFHNTKYIIFNIFVQPFNHEKWQESLGNFKKWGEKLENFVGFEI